MKSDRGSGTPKAKIHNGLLLRFEVRLPYRPPFDWSRMLTFFQEMASL